MKQFIQQIFIPEADIKMQLPASLNHYHGPVEFSGLAKTIFFATISFTMNWINMQELDALIVILIHLVQLLTAALALVIALLTFLKFLRERRNK